MIFAKIREGTYQTCANLGRREDKNQLQKLNVWHWKLLSLLVFRERFFILKKATLCRCFTHLVSRIRWTLNWFRCPGCWAVRVLRMRRYWTLEKFSSVQIPIATNQFITFDQWPKKNTFFRHDKLKGFHPEPINTFHSKLTSSSRQSLLNWMIVSARETTRFRSYGFELWQSFPFQWIWLGLKFLWVTVVRSWYPVLIHRIWHSFISLVSSGAV